MAIHVFHDVFNSARLYMKMASWVFCVLVFDLSGECAALPGGVVVNVAGESGSEFKVGHVKSCDEVPTVEQDPPMDFKSGLWQSVHCIWQSSGQWYICDESSGHAEAAVFLSGCGGISTEAETRSQTRR